MSNGQFKKVLGRRDVLALSFGAMIGWSWVAIAGDWVVEGGSLGAVLAFVIGGFATVLIGLTYAELAAAMPKAGGEHVYSERALGRTASFICTWAIIFAYVDVVAFEAVALASAVDYLVPNLKHVYLWSVAGWDVYLTWALVGVSGAVTMTVINVIGIRQAAIFQTIATTVIAVAGIGFLIGAFANGSTANMEPLFASGTVGVIGVLVMVPTMMVGFDVIPQSAEEIDLPGGEIGRMLVISVVMAVAWYLLIILGVSMAIEPAGLAGADLTTPAAATAAWRSPVAGTLLVLGGIGGILTSWNALLVGASRAIYALARAGQLPDFLGKLHPKYGTPANAIILVGALSVAAPFFGRPVMIWLVDVGSFSVVIAYGLVAWSFLVLRKKEPDMPRPYKVANGELVGRTAFALSLGLFVLYLPGSPAALIWQEWAIGGGWVALGAVMFFVAHRKQARA
jgi:APA family basic amino acid/polyamine antiporter